MDFHGENVMKYKPYGVILDPDQHKAKDCPTLLASGGRYIGIGRKRSIKDLMDGMAYPGNITFTNIDIMDLYRDNKRRIGRY